ncbi:MAG TPA: hypothetical protein VJB59_11490 [Bdellovibrionota bacterium]|nr:hypothetical protein [Bdellovibrionota bacterium]
MNEPHAIHSDSGMTLLETVLAMGMMSIVLYTSLMMLNNVNLTQTTRQLGFSRNNIVSLIRMSALTQPGISNSAALTSFKGTGGFPDPSGAATNYPRFNTLSLCIPEDSTQSGCDKSAMDTTRGNFFYLTTPQATSAAAANALAGEHIYYNASGARCGVSDSANANVCPIFAKVWFEPFCKDSSTNCSKAAYLMVRYSVGIRDGYTRTNVIPPVEGELYISLQKGIQISRLLDQNGSELTSSNGMYRIPKALSATATVKGIRIEALVSNPTGLSNYRVQVRSVSGTEAFGKTDATALTALNAKTWNDVSAFNTIPALGSTQQNQSIVFGSYNGTNQSWSVLGPWTISGGVPAAPTFKSGYYQFRVLAAAPGGGDLPSTNFATIRILQTPQILIVDPPLGTSYDRDCREGAVATASSKFFAVDDEGLLEIRTSLLGAPAGVTPTPPPEQVDDQSSTHPTIYPDATTPRSVTVGLGYPAHDAYQLRIIAKASPDREVIKDQTFALQEVVRTWNVESVPAKIRYMNTDTVTATYTAGSCCTANPGATVNWFYPEVPVRDSTVAKPALSGPSTTGFNCSTSGNQKRCTATVNVQGINIGPLNQANDIIAEAQFPTDAACSFPDNRTNKSIEVTALPKIAFFTRDSLWMDLPSAEQFSNMPQSFTRTIRLRIDFSPQEEVRVKVTQVGTETALCEVTFEAGTGSTPVDKPCNLGGALTGDLVIKPVSANVASAPSLITASHRAAIAESTIHSTCSTALTADPEYPAIHTIPETKAMTLSPWGSTTLGDKDDEGNWIAGRTKKLRCYDRTPYHGCEGCWGLPENYGPTPNYSNWQDNYYSVDIHNEQYPTAPVYRKLYVDFSSFLAWRTAPGTADFTAKNVPSLFVIARASTNVAGRFTFWSATAGFVQTEPIYYEDITPRYCPALPETRLYRLKFQAPTSGTASMVGVNGVRNEWNTPGFTQVGYAFFCTYGHWNTMGKENSPNEL